MDIIVGPGMGVSAIVGSSSSVSPAFVSMGLGKGVEMAEQRTHGPFSNSDSMQRRSKNEAGASDGKGSEWSSGTHAEIRFVYPSSPAPGEYSLRGWKEARTHPLEQ